MIIPDCRYAFFWAFLLAGVGGLYSEAGATNYHLMQDAQIASDQLDFGSLRRQISENIESDLETSNEDRNLVITRGQLFGGFYCGRYMTYVESEPPTKLAEAYFSVEIDPETDDWRRLRTGGNAVAPDTPCHPIEDEIQQLENLITAELRDQQLLGEMRETAVLLDFDKAQVTRIASGSKGHSNEFSYSLMDRRPEQSCSVIEFGRYSVEFDTDQRVWRSLTIQEPYSRDSGC